MLRSLKAILAALVCAVSLPVAAADFTALARLVPGSAQSLPDGDGLVVTLGLSQAVPYRVFTLDAPRRLVADFSELDWAGVDPGAFVLAGRAGAAAAGRLGPGWSRLVVPLEAPLAVRSVEMATGAAARLDIRLHPVSEADFAARAGAPDSALFRLPDPVRGLAPPRTRQTGDRPLVVVIDPGHGGIDPGAVRGAVQEAELMLTFARELRETLRRTDRFEVVLTRDADVFVPLERRISIARAAGADVLLSLHADSLAEGQARGTTVYTLADTATDLATQTLAERHDREDLLAGLDLSRQDDAIAGVLMGMARTETQPRSDALADYLVGALGHHLGRMHKRPRLGASFSVLKAPDIPSVLVELGFMSNVEDLENLTSAAWRAQAAAGIRDGLLAWAAADAADAALIRQ